MAKRGNKTDAFHRLRSAVYEMWHDIHTRKNTTFDKINVCEYCRLYNTGVTRKSLFEESLTSETLPTDRMIHKIMDERRRHNYESQETSKARNREMHERNTPSISFEQMKVCQKCGKEKPISEFYRRGDVEGGQSYCKDCDKGHGALRNGVTGVYRSPKYKYREWLEAGMTSGWLTVELAKTILKDNNVTGTLTYTESL